MAHTNRLANERSPYLLQHAHNPVDWYAWGDEAFEKARREDKPVFLSIGYSACHWCHVMERESFEDEATAKFLNEHFVSVKVDREERPDVDQIYQLAHQVITQRAGGWPLSAFLLPDKRPFFAGTYFPNARRYNMPTFMDVLAAILDAYRNKRHEVDEQAGELTRVVMNVSSTTPGTKSAIEASAIDDVRASVMRRAEPRSGGFGRAPKFPNTMTLDLLAIAATECNDTRARDHLFVTLDHMARGGIYDHLGGGFARYSTDEKWLIPHFEKMLYDNAQLARLYTDGWRARTRWPGEAPTRDALATVVRETLTYVLREMTDPTTGAFFSAQDADSEGEEGKFFVWTPDELEAVLGKDDAAVVARVFDVTTEGNFEHGKSALWRPEPLDAIAAQLGKSVSVSEAVIVRARPLLFAAREKRVKPMRDDKSLASWNGLMIGAMAEAGATFGERTWLDAALRALAAWRDRAFTNDRLAHAMKHGDPYGTGFLDDYAGLAVAAIDVYEATFDPAALQFARTLIDRAIDLFWDDAEGSFYYSPRDAEVVIQRTREVHDHAYPGGYGLVADALLRLAEFTGVLRYRSIAERALEQVAAMARENPLGLGTVARAIDRAARGSIEVVVIGDASRADTQALLRAVREVYLPHRLIVCARDEAEARAHGIDASLVEGRTAAADGGPRVFVCRGTACSMPVTTPDALRETLVASAVPT